METELKYVVPAHRTAFAIKLLERLCDPDPEFPVGVVSSIYYDSRDWAYLLEKRNSDYLKTKVRLRWYEQSAPGAASADECFAEVKIRVGSRRTKFRIPMERRGAEFAAMDLEDRELLRIPSALLAAGAPIRHTVFPAFLVRYSRRRFIDRLTSSRIAIDYAISSPKVNRHMVAGAFPCALDRTVLEVKGTDGKFPARLQDVFKLGFRKEAFSKYFECYRLLTQSLF